MAAMRRPKMRSLLFRSKMNSYESFFGQGLQGNLAAFGFLMQLLDFFAQSC
jgi:hypothetical protein